jgi:hypothetical protein
MARVTTGKSKTASRSAMGRVSSATSRTSPRSAPQSRALAKVAAGAASTSKEELRARVEKLERANATLRIKNKELRLAYVEAAETVDALTIRLANSERRGERQARPDAPASAGATRDGGRSARAKKKATTVEAETETDAALEATASDWASAEHAEA